MVVLTIIDDFESTGKINLWNYFDKGIVSPRKAVLVPKTTSCESKGKRRQQPWDSSTIFKIIFSLVLF